MRRSSPPRRTRRSRNPTIAMMARDGSNIKGAGDMSGKRVGVPGLNGGNHIVAMKWLQNNGVDPK